jgi:putative membrane protein
MKNRPDFKISFLLLSFITVVLLFGIAACNTHKETDTTATESEVVENQNATTPSDVDTSNTMDAQFLVEAAEINLGEIALGQLAQKNTKNADVLALAKMMIEEHNKALDEVKGLADKKNITLPSTPPSDEESQALMPKKGKEFDKAFSDAMVNGHKKAIEEFEMASKNCKDEDIKGWASATLPTLHRHLEHSMECQKKTATL